MVPKTNGTHRKACRGYFFPKMLEGGKLQNVTSYQSQKRKYQCSREKSKYLSDYHRWKKRRIYLNLTRNAMSLKLYLWKVIHETKRTQKILRSLSFNPIISRKKEETIAKINPTWKTKKSLNWQKWSNPLKWPGFDWSKKFPSGFFLKHLQPWRRI